MEHILFQYANYNDNKQHMFETIIEENTQEYCYANNIQYITFNNKHEHALQRHHSWSKVFYLYSLMLASDDNTVITWVDADMLIKDHTINLKPINKLFALSVDTANTLNCGWFSVVNNADTRFFVEQWISEEFYEQINHEQIVQSWWEQGALYYLLGIVPETKAFVRHPQVFDLDYYKNNLEEFDVRDCSYNVSSYLIQHPTNIKIRHYSGGERWFSLTAEEKIRDKIYDSPII